ncbi:MAG: UvrD-helicase domain-containing protein [Pseudoxanthomonas sp.]
MNDAAPRDLAFALPLSGAYLVEASAGTGKTFTLTAWVLRLLLEVGIPLPKLLVVTFTRAAAAELRERVRRRLRVAERVLAGQPVEGAEAQQTLALVEHARRQGIDAATLRLRLQAALLQLDEATISTIHGFCASALREFGFLAGALGDDEVIDNADSLWEEVAADLWRAASNGVAAGFGFLTALWTTPGALAKSLKGLCDPARKLLPETGETDIATWLHGLRADASARFERKLDESRQRTQDQLIERVWQASALPRFAAALKRRWPLMLVDEFQDTDPRQWRIFRNLFEAEADTVCAPGLFLIGDPKQAIYRFRGGDLPTYVEAREYARARGGEATLDVNYRSRPAVLKAVETLFAASDDPFVRDDIVFRHVEPAHAEDEDALTIDGAPPPGMIVHWLPPPEDPAKNKRAKPDDEASSIATTVAEIARLLNHGNLRERGAVRPLRADDIAVLVRTNAQAAAVRDALARAGIAAATQGNDSVFASAAAGEVHLLLEACAHPADPSRMRAALATRLLGASAAEIAALEENEAAARAWQAKPEQALLAWQQRGPLPALLPFLTARSSQLLREDGGARLLTDALHLAELLQAEAPMRHGVHGLLRWYRQQCATRPGHDAAALRLDSDAQAVQVVTLHKSKGLEYSVVFLPFAAFAGGSGSGGVRSAQLTEGGQPASYFHCTRGSGKHREMLLGSPSHHDEWLQRSNDDDRAEDLRLLYVGLTRARHALHLTWGHGHDSNDTALQWLLHHGEKAGRKNDKLQPDGMRERIEQLAAGSGGSIVVRPMSATDAVAEPLQHRGASAEKTPAARQAIRSLRTTAGQYSFSGLRARHAESLPTRGADDEDNPITLRGADFGNAVHAVLEATDFSAWRGMTAAPESQRRNVADALAEFGLKPTPTNIAQTGALVAAALNAPLPGSVTLSRLDASRRVTEMEFHFRLGKTGLPALHALLEQHGYPRAHPPAHGGEIEGLMHGYIDLVYRDEAGAFHVLDYKTNDLRGDYRTGSLREAVAQNDYDLQYLIYLVALQRWLKLRFGKHYDAGKHLGGAVYLFLRGLQPGDGASGIHRDRPPQALIDAVDALFDGGTA